MSKINIKTLTSVHIGSGNMLQYNYDFVSFNDESYIRILDYRKIMDLVGKERINDWVVGIEQNKDNTAMIKGFAPKSNPDNYTKRKIDFCADDIKHTDSLKECIHDGRGLPYIPGSSIKGAIRTAVLASLVGKYVPNAENYIKNGIDKASASEIEKMLFGNDPTKDVFKFIRVGDAFFSDESEIAIRLINLNIRNSKDYLKDSSKSQLIDVIREQESSSFNLTIDDKKYDFAVSHHAMVGNLRAEFNNINNLFTLINDHSLSLVSEEINRWADIDKTGAEDYVDNMKTILDQINACQKGKECVLRIGHASGWRFTTGGWAEGLNNFSSTVVPQSRPKNYNYEGYVFPKTRRLDTAGDILGFVKLSIAE